MRLRAVSLAAVLATVAAASPARAQVDDATRSAARTLAESGLALQEAGDHAGAFAKYERALALVQVPTLAVLSARCLIKLGRLVEASERYRMARAMTVDPSLPEGYRAAQIEAQGQAESERAALVKRIPVLEIALEGAAPAQVELRIDNVVVPAATLGVERPIDPGLHRIEVRRGTDVATRNVELKEGERGRIVLTLPLRATVPIAIPGAPIPERDGTTQRIAGGVVMALGGAAAIAGGVTWGLALGQKSDLDTICTNEICKNPTQKTKDALASYDTLRGATIGMMAGGGVLLGAGLVTLLTAPSGKAPRKAGITPWIGPASAGVYGAF
jgi:hypothetical protein